MSRRGAVRPARLRVSGPGGTLGRVPSDALTPPPDDATTPAGAPTDASAGPATGAAASVRAASVPAASVLANSGTPAGRAAARGRRRDERRPRALVLVGRGRYEDAWHDGAATAGVLQPLLAADGWDVHVHGTSPDLLADDGLVAATVGRPDLVVVSAGTGRTDAAFDGDDAAWAGFHAALGALVAGGVPLLALHAAANTFHDAPGWSGLVGGRWVDGTSWHPPIGTATFDVADPAHPVTAGLGSVEAFDERYCDLLVDPASHVLLTTRHEGRDHPVVWVAPGPARVVYDALGHDVRAWASPSRRELVRRTVAWLAGR